MELFLALANAVALPEKQAPARIMILAAGVAQPKGIDVRAPWRLDDPASVVAMTKRMMGAADIVIDYEHQTFKSDQNGRPAPAAGWIKSLDADASGIWANVEWTDAAKAMIEAGEYRYYSPVFTYTKARQITAIRGLALTNDPALADLPALARAQSHISGDAVLNLDELRAALGLGAEVSDADVLIAAAKAATNATAAAKALGVSAGLQDETFVAEVETAMATATKTVEKTPDPAKFVPMAMFEEVRGDLAMLKANGEASAADTAVAAAMETGRVTPAQKDWATGYAKSDPKGFASFIDKAPVIVAGGEVLNGQHKAGSGGLSVEEVATCKAMGLSQDEFKAARGDKKQEAA